MLFPRRADVRSPNAGEQRQQEHILHRGGTLPELTEENLHFLRLDESITGAYDVIRNRGHWAVINVAPFVSNRRFIQRPKQVHRMVGRSRPPRAVAFGRFLARRPNVCLQFNTHRSVDRIQGVVLPRK